MPVVKVERKRKINKSANSLRVVEWVEDCHVDGESVENWRWTRPTPISLITPRCAMTSPVGMYSRLVPESPVRGLCPLGSSVVPHQPNDTEAAA